MFLSEPPRTNYDISFSLFGFPVRVHPAFFVMPLLLGGAFLRDPEMNAGVTLLILISVFFLSILVHELGHALAFRYYGQPSRIVLYWMGGLAIPDSGSGPWAPRSSVSLNPQQQIVVSLAGPIFGFLLAGLFVAIVFAMGGTIQIHRSQLLPTLVPVFDDGISNAVWVFFYLSIWANIFINMLNLVPVFPLDGGQVARQLLVLNDSWNGVKHSIMLSIAAAAIIAFLSFASGDKFIGFFFGFMAWSNYMTLQQLGGGGYGGGRPW